MRDVARGSALPSWVVGITVGVALAWVVAAATLGVLTFGGLFIGSVLTGRIARATSPARWAAAAILTILVFAGLYLAAARSKAGRACFVPADGALGTRTAEPSSAASFGGSQAAATSIARSSSPSLSSAD